MNIGAVSNLAHYLSRDEWVQTQFENPEDIFDALSKASDRQINLIKELRKTKRVLKIREILINLGLKAKPYEN